METFIVISEDGSYLMHRRQETHIGYKDNFDWTTELNYATVFTDIFTVRRMLDKNGFASYTKIPAKEVRTVVIGDYNGNE